MSLNVVQKSFGWSAIGEVCAKFVSPVATMILARLLTPADFGVLAVCNMVLFFLDIIVDAGFSKYLVQRDFKDRPELYRYTNVAFIATMAVAVLLWFMILVFHDAISRFVGGEEYSFVIVVTSFQMLIVAYISPRLALLRRDFQYKKLCLYRILPAFIPLIVTVPMAYFTRSYWALVAGSFAMYIMQSVLIRKLCGWRLSGYWSFGKLREMFGFSFWSLCEGLAHWLMFWIDTFILTRHFSSYYVGLYKNSSALVMSLFMMVATAVVPVLFSSLSRIRNRDESYRLVLAVERLILYILLPACAVMWFNKDVITSLLLGSQWSEASVIIGLWSIIMTVSISMYSFPAEAFKAEGRPKYLFIYQCCYLAFLLPVCYVSSTYGFWEFVYARFCCVFVQIVLFAIFAKSMLHWTICKFFLNAIRPLLIAVSVVIANLIICHIVQHDTGLIRLILNVLIVVALYFLFRSDIVRSFGLIKLNKM